MMAWMNRESLAITLRTGVAVYWSRSRGALWRKGESSGQTQAVTGLTVDCDGDTVLVEVDQVGVACHTGRRSCFYMRVGEGGRWRSRWGWRSTRQSCMGRRVPEDRCGS
ncbi:hypothetical protein BU14_0230s0005 [Porphyra umbilicalis]|uniref:phosphoribosyl-AMP cyclohydrolase n=1 Tax=Porphyra umbilicalis TaxID=2786 RepID=A0A1X6P3Y3_PORUM|nr:hypothetical protein BU14_0230s0005 [Porphyra umbilicalis]|eukprot:OSX75582.1 hypothetical protein BU14_0230s0005 [Porphyra umbilicalis]